MKKGHIQHDNVACLKGKIKKMVLEALDAYRVFGGALSVTCQVGRGTSAAPT